MPERAEIEAVGLAMRETVRTAPHVPTWDELAGVAIEVIDRVRDARGDDEAGEWPDSGRPGHSSVLCGIDGYLCRRCRGLDPPARSPQGEDHEAGVAREGLQRILDMDCPLGREGDLLGEAQKIASETISRLSRVSPSCLAGESNEGGNQNDERRH